MLWMRDRDPNRLWSPGSGSALEMKIWPHAKKFECSLFSADGFSRSLNGLHGGLGILKVLFFILKSKYKISTINIFNIWSSKPMDPNRELDPDPHWSKMLDPDPHWNQFWSTTLPTVLQYKEKERINLDFEMYGWSHISQQQLILLSSLTFTTERALW